MQRIALLVLVIMLSGCTVTHKWGERPKLKVNNPYADDTKVKLKHDSIVVTVYWDI